MCLFVKDKEPPNSDIEVYKIIQIHKDWNFNKNKNISPITTGFRKFPIFAGENVAQGNLKLKTGGIYDEGCIHCFYPSHSLAGNTVNLSGRPLVR